MKLKKDLALIRIFCFIVNKFSYELKFYLVVLLSINKNFEIKFYYIILYLNIVINLYIKSNKRFLLNNNNIL